MIDGGQHKRRKSQPSEICRQHCLDSNCDNRFRTADTRSRGKEQISWLKAEPTKDQGIAIRALK